MTDFLLELRCEEIPARMQIKASEDLARLFTEELAKAGLTPDGIDSFVTPRRLALIARGLPLRTQAVAEERKGPRADAPAQALEGFLRSTGLTRDQLVERTDPKGNAILFAVIEKPGRATAEVIADAIPTIIRAFPWPKSMRWGTASETTTSLRWVRPLQGIVAILGEELVDIEIDGIRSGYTTLGHRFHHPDAITIGGANDYVEKLRACHVIASHAERQAIIAQKAQAAAAAHGLTLVDDKGLIAENAGLTEWPVPLLGDFDPDFLEVPPEVIQLTLRTNQKYFVLCYPPRSGEGDQPQAGGGGLPNGATLAPAFICTANIDAHDGGAAIIAGNRKVLAARLSDARFFWEQDKKTTLADHAKKLERITFHEKLGTVADKVERVAKLARWLVDEGIVESPSPLVGEGRGPSATADGKGEGDNAPLTLPPHPSDASRLPPSPTRGEGNLATLAEQAARLCKADLVTEMVGEFPELQGLMGGYYARAEGLDPQVADAIRDHYKPVGQGDDVPTAPVTVAVSLADKLDSLIGFFLINEGPTGSRDPFALRRSALGVIALIQASGIRLTLMQPISRQMLYYDENRIVELVDQVTAVLDGTIDLLEGDIPDDLIDAAYDKSRAARHEAVLKFAANAIQSRAKLLEFFADRLKVQQREAGVRHDLIDAVFAFGGEDDLVRLLARVKALQSFVGSEDGINLLAGYKRAANILKKDAPALSNVVTPAQAGVSGDSAPMPEVPAFAGTTTVTLSYTPEIAEAALIAALDTAEPRAADAVAREDFEGAMSALATLRAPIDAFFETVIVNDPVPDKRAARLALLARVRDAVHSVADFSRIEG